MLTVECIPERVLRKILVLKTVCYCVRIRVNEWFPAMIRDADGLKPNRYSGRIDPVVLDIEGIGQVNGGAAA
ncbi:hypothetical protein PATA110616_15115 [Paenibacillus tarimensis]